MIFKKLSLWIRNLEGNLFQIDCNLKSELWLAEKKNERFDVQKECVKCVDYKEGCFCLEDY